MDNRPPSAHPGRRLLGGRYEVFEVLGRGGMGEVRAGRDRRLERDVAIKLLRADLAHDPAIRQRFQNEARLAARLTHPYIVAVYDTGEDRGIPFLVMERLPGTTLADALAGGPLPWPEVQTIGLQLLAALEAAHASGLVHRDVKPGNIMAAGPNHWKVGDFGIAKSLDVVDQNLTGTGFIVGTPRYLAPERLAGGPATAGGDLYSVGVVLYEALTGRRLFDAPDPLTLLTAIPQPLTDLRPDVPPALAAVVMRAIARRPEDRFATAAEMAAAVGQSSPAEATVAPQYATTVATGGAPAPGATGLMARPRRRRHAHRRPFTLAAAAAAVVLASTAFVLSTGGRSPAGTRVVTGAVTTTTTSAASTTTVPAITPPRSVSVEAGVSASHAAPTAHGHRKKG